MSDMMDDELDLDRIDSQRNQRRLVWVLSLAGAVPFVLPAAIVWILGIANPLSEPLIEIFRSYSVVILSFLGGIRWGHALLRERDDNSSIDILPVFCSVLPSLIAWGTVFLDTVLALSILLLAFCAMGAWDSFSAQLGKLPKWFSPVRMVLTSLVALAHIAVILVYAQ